VLRLPLPGLALQERTLRGPAPEVVPRQVDDGPAQVGVDRVAITDVVEAGREPDEGLLRQVLGEGPIAGQQIRKADGLRGRADVRFG
jgi:hypothetical protein